MYLVATPIGNLGDLSPRAVEVLQGVDRIAAEDTRHSRPLLRHFGITTPLFSLHEHNEREAMAKVIAYLQGGESIALISDAGTPLISDPGFPLVRECQRLGMHVSPIPGACALVCALSASGLATDRFIFEGFSVRTRGARRTRMEALKGEGRTMVFYESSHRVRESLQDMADIFGADRPAVLARELTKQYETLLSERLGVLCQRLDEDPMQQKGEFVLLVAGAEKPPEEALDSGTEHMLSILMEALPVRQAASLTARITGLKKNRLYRHALALRDSKQPESGDA